MGLDQYVYRVKKPSLEDRVYTREEISSLGLASVFIESVERAEHLYQQLFPYVVKANVSAQFYNVEKIISDYNLPKNSSIGYISSQDGIALYGTDSNGNHIRHAVSAKEVDEKYTITKVKPSYVWKEEEQAYWRKDYDLQGWIYDTIEGVDNTGYYILDANLINEINDKFDADIPEEGPTEESAMFYWEWY